MLPITPSLRRMMRSVWSATDCSCVTQMIVMPISVFTRRSRCITSRDVALSRAPVGSSARMIRGRLIRARAMANIAALAARHLVGHVGGPVAQPQHFEVFRAPGVALTARHALVVERKGDVFHGVLVAYEVERLEYVSDHAVAGGRGLRLAQPPDQPPREVVAAAVVVVEDSGGCSAVWICPSPRRP